MKIVAVILSLTLLASPCLAGVYTDQSDGVLMVMAKDKKKDAQPAGGKVVIKGKGGKVTDVDKKPTKSGKKQ